MVKVKAGSLVEVITSTVLLLIIVGLASMILLRVAKNVSNTENKNRNSTQSKLRYNMRMESQHIKFNNRVPLKAFAQDTVSLSLPKVYVFKP